MMQNEVVIESPLGLIKLRVSEKAVTDVSIVKGVKPTRPQSDLLKRATQELKLYFDGKLKKFTFPISFEGTKFQRKVWEELLKIPFGKTLTYGDIAKKVGRPRAYRAVGGAVHRNALGIVVPCHRVVGAHGYFGGYAGGIHLKKWLIRHEAQG